MRGFGVVFTCSGQSRTLLMRRVMVLNTFRKFLVRGVEVPRWKEKQTYEMENCVWFELVRFLRRMRSRVD